MKIIVDDFKWKSSLIWIVTLAFISAGFRMSPSGGPYLALWFNAILGVGLIVWSVKTHNSLRGQGLMMLSALPLAQMVSSVVTYAVSSFSLAIYAPGIVISLASLVAAWICRPHPKDESSPAKLPRAILLLVASAALGMLADVTPITLSNVGPIFPIHATNGLKHSVLLLVIAFWTGFGVQWLFHGLMFTAIQVDAGAVTAVLISAGTSMVVTKHTTAHSMFAWLVLNLLYGISKARGEKTSLIGVANGLFNVMLIVSAHF